MVGVLLLEGGPILIPVKVHLGSVVHLPTKTRIPVKAHLLSMEKLVHLLSMETLVHLLSMEKPVHLLAETLILVNVHLFSVEKPVHLPTKTLIPVNVLFSAKEPIEIVGVGIPVDFSSFHSCCRDHITTDQTCARDKRNKLKLAGIVEKLPHVANLAKCVAATTSRAQDPNSQIHLICLRACTPWNWTSSKLIPGSCVVCARIRFCNQTEWP